MKRLCLLVVSCLAGVAMLAAVVLPTRLDVRRVTETEASSVFGAGWCGGSYYISNSCACNRAANCAWACGPVMNLDTGGWDDLEVASITCGPGCAGTGSDAAPACTW